MTQAKIFFLCLRHKGVLKELRDIGHDYACLAYFYLYFIYNIFLTIYFLSLVRRHHHEGYLLGSLPTEHPLTFVVVIQVIRKITKSPYLTQKDLRAKS